MTTFSSYGVVSSHRQAEIIEALGQAPTRLFSTDGVPTAETIQKVLRHLSDKNG
jgi:hypothetical protein